MKMSFKFTMTIVFSMLIVLVGVVNAQNIPVPVECGTILESELKEVEQSPSYGNEPHNYQIELAPADSITVEVTPIGVTPNIFFRLFDPSGKLNYDTGWGRGPGEAEVMQNFVVAASGTYVIGIGASTIGAYSIAIGCVLRDGTIINPGDTQTAPSSTPVLNTAPFNGVGFPGLPAVDFANVVEIPVISGTSMTGVITPTGGEIVGFSFTGETDQLVDIVFARLSGNLNLGIVVLSSENKVVFQASLVTSEMITTQVRLPTAGAYTIGLFRIDLLPPTDPEGTAFQLTTTLN